ncbi:MAG: hypothetical protein Q8Q94_03770 [bacterium]|nr:hypothetical protein [bacterium]
MKLAFSLVFSFLVFAVLPASALAQSTEGFQILPRCSFITQEGGVSVLTSPCNACDFILLIQNLLKFTYTYLIPFFAALYLAWGGILMLSAGLTANPSQYQRGKAAIATTLKGILILLLAWLIIDTILKVAGARIATDSPDPQFFRPWNTVECHAPRAPNVVIPNTANIIPPPTPAPGTGGVPGDGTPGGLSSLSETEGRAQLQRAGINVNNAVCPAGITARGCTNIAGMRSATLNRVIQLKNDCGCDILVTGGTEGGHAAGEVSHSTGYKVDVRPSGKLDDYIKRNYTNIGVRSDGAAQWRAPDGAIFAREENHWDITVPGK